MPGSKVVDTLAHLALVSLVLLLVPFARSVARERNWDVAESLRRLLRSPDGGGRVRAHSVAQAAAIYSALAVSALAVGAATHYVGNILTWGGLGAVDPLRAHPLALLTYEASHSTNALDALVHGLTFAMVPALAVGLAHGWKRAPAVDAAHVARVFGLLFGLLLMVAGIANGALLTVPVPADSLDWTRVLDPLPTSSWDNFPAWPWAAFYGPVLLAVVALLLAPREARGLDIACLVLGVLLLPVRSVLQRMAGHTYLCWAHVETFSDALKVAMPVSLALPFSVAVAFEIWRARRAGKRGRE